MVDVNLQHETASGEFGLGSAAPISRNIRGSGIVGAAFVLTDMAAVLLAFGIACLAAHLPAILIAGDLAAMQAEAAARATEFALLGFLFLGACAYGQLYERSGWETRELPGIVGAVALAAFVDIALQYILKDRASTPWLFLAWPVAVLLAVTFRMSVRGLPAIRRALTSHVILVGSGIDPDAFEREFRSSNTGKADVLRSMTFDEAAAMGTHALRGHVHRLARDSGLFADQLRVVIAPASGERDAARKLLGSLSAAGVPVSTVLPWGGASAGSLNLRQPFGADMILCESEPAAGQAPVAAFAAKRGLDLALASIALVLLSPVLLMIGILLLLEDGPVFYAQRRVGFAGRRFDCLKFRSMRPDAEERLAELLAADPEARAEWDAHQKLENDPRITRVGAFLRATSLDELPQLFNVLRGEMSLVGPRPVVAPEIAGYDNDRAYVEGPSFGYYARSMPGITGAWQVSGRAKTKYGERIRLDRWYARNWSIWLDVIIMLKTFRAVIARTGS